MSEKFKILKSQNSLNTTELETFTDEFKRPHTLVQLDTNLIDKFKNQLSESKNKQQATIVAFEKDEKRFKALKRYGEVLQLIEKLLGIMPTDLENLSLEELKDKLDNLIKSRKRNDYQMTFIFFQNLYTNSLKNLLKIEKDFKEGKITSKDAFNGVRNIKKEIKSNENESPKILSQTNAEVNHLITVFENSYSNADSKNLNPVKLKETDIKLEHELLFNQLNEQTSEVMKNIDGLTNTLFNFEPIADLTKLSENLKSTEEILDNPNWTADDLNMSLSTLENTTTKLTDEQIDKNNQMNEIHETIQETTKTVNKLAETSIKDVVNESFKDVASRAIESQTIINNTENLINDNNTPTSCGDQIANVIISQIEKDKEFCEKIATVEGVETTYMDLEPSEKAEELAENLKDKVLTKEEQQEIVLTLMKEKEDSESSSEEKKE